MVAAGKDLVQSLSIEFSSTDFDNPGTLLVLPSFRCPISAHAPCSLSLSLSSALQQHYATLQALALNQDEIPQVEDVVVPDEEGMAKVSGEERRRDSVIRLSEERFLVRGEVTNAGRQT
jgi:hypothetical protein